MSLVYTVCPGVTLGHRHVMPADQLLTCCFTATSSDLQVTWVAVSLLMTLFHGVVPFPLSEPQRTQPVGQGNRETLVRPSQVDLSPMPCKHFISPRHSVPWGVVLQWEDVQAGQQLGRHEYSARSDCLFQDTAERKLAAWLPCPGAWVANIKTWRGE